MGAGPGVKVACRWRLGPVGMSHLAGFSAPLAGYCCQDILLWTASTKAFKAVGIPAFAIGLIIL